MKICKECEVEKQLSDFYAGQAKCKECVKKQVRSREATLKLDPVWVEKEKQRHREKYHKLGYKDRHKPTPEKKKEIIERYRKNHPEKELIRKASSWLKPKTKGNHLHHWNYNTEFAKDVIELSPEIHKKIHRFIKYDKKTFMFKTLDGVLLDSKKEHLKYINKVALL